MQKFTLDTTNCNRWVTPAARAGLCARLEKIHDGLLAHTGAGREFLGWLDLPVTASAQLPAIAAAAARIRQQAQVLVVVGIGGSHLGGQAGLEFVRGAHCDQLAGEWPVVLFAGHNVSASDWRETLALIGERDWALNVISKSGTTLEPALAFGYFQDQLERRYGRAAADTRIYATTDGNTGLLHDQAVARGWTRFVVPDDVGGRYSALTPVGLLPWAVGGIQLEAVLAGASAAREQLTSRRDDTNPAWKYAATRYLLLQQGIGVELLATYEPRLRTLARWWQQLFGESEGKTDRVLFPATLELTADLHSLGQYLQQGQKFLLETSLWLETAPADLPVTLDDASAAKFEFLRGRDLSFVNQQAYQATTRAHTDGGVPNLAFTLGAADEWHLGYTLYFFEFACALSAYLLGVNPFDQPGVQAYKSEMMERLGA